MFKTEPATGRDKRSTDDRSFANQSGSVTASRILDKYALRISCGREVEYKSSCV